jgi:hypothetical protein
MMTLWVPIGPERAKSTTHSVIVGWEAGLQVKRKWNPASRAFWQKGWWA